MINILLIFKQLGLITICASLTIFIAVSNSFADPGKANKLFRKGFNQYFGKNKNDNKAIELLQQSSDLENISAQFLLAQIYEEGVNGVPNASEAIKYYKLAAKNGNVHAQSHLGLLYRTGEFVKQDFEISFKYYLMASRQADGWSQYRLGQFYEYGNGAPQDYEKAIFYYQMSANNDEIKAINALARIHEHNASKSRENLILALKWHLIGAQRHHELISEVNSKRLSEVLSKEEVKQAKKSAKSWKPTRSKR